MSSNKVTDFAFFSGAALAVTAVGATGAQAQQDVTGFYGGVSLNFAEGTELFDFGSDYTMASSGVVGAFAGYNTVSGDWVYGGELNFAGGSFPASGYGGDFDIGNVVDLRARAGKVFGNTLVYGAAGLTFAEANVFGNSENVSGFNLGLGFETSVTDDVFLGAEYTFRELSNDDGLYTSSATTNLNTLSVRVGMRF